MDFADLLKQVIGLDATTVGQSAIDSAVRFRMSGCGLRKQEDYWQRLRESEHELQQLVEAVVVPETWFFRNEEAFRVLVQLAVEEWLPTHPSGAFRLLSAPCSTGEEPYSMAMALITAGVPRVRFEIDALDVNLTGLAQARQGLYGSNSFRVQDLSFRDRYFSKTRAGYKLTEELTALVKFHHGNLLSADFRSGLGAYDVIFCRNLLIYFDRQTQANAIEALRGMLTAAGYLFVGAAETFLASSMGFIPLNRSLAFGFRKRRSGHCASETFRPFRAKNRATIIRVAPAPAKPLRVYGPVKIAHDHIALGIEHARVLADKGQFAAAIEICEKYLDGTPDCVDGQYLLAVLYDTRGDKQHAMDGYRKVLYMNPHHGEALMHLALLLEAQGQGDSAALLRKRAGLCSDVVRRISTESK